MCTRLTMTLLLVLLVLTGVQAQNDPVIGTWKLNVAKSKFNPGPPPKNEIVKYEQSGQGIDVSFDGVNAQGRKIAVHYKANWDGKDYPVTGAQDHDSISINRIDLNTAEVFQKKDGKVVTTVRRVVSQDGQLLTATANGTNAQGKPVNNVIVYEKQ